MPNSLQTLDTNFPKIDNHQTTEENFLQVTNYLYMLLENLRYTLGNLGEDNFNDTELDGIAKMIREPIMVQLKDTEGRVANLGIEAARLSARLEDAEGNINAFNATAAGWYARIEDAEGNISNLSATSQLLSSQISSLDGTVSNIQQTANTLTTRIQTAEGDISSLTQTANSLSSKVSDAEGNLSSLTQTVNGMSLSVSNGNSSSTIKLMRDGVAVSSKTIQFSGMVTFSDLSKAGQTTINGSNITTGMISSDYIRLYGSMGVYTGSTIAGYIGYTTSANDGSAGMHMKKSNGEVVVTANGAKLDYAGGTSQVSANSGGVGMTSNGTNYYVGQSSFYNTSDCLLGQANNPWGQIYSTNSAISTSDRNKKNSIELMDDRYLRLFDLLTPYRFKFDNGTSDRYHPGFISQDVEDVLELVGLDSKEFAGFVKDVDPDTGEDLYFLRYEEFIAILALKIKQQDERIRALEEAA